MITIVFSIMDQRTQSSQRNYKFKLQPTKNTFEHLSYLAKQIHNTVHRHHSIQTFLCGLALGLESFAYR